MAGHGRPVSPSPARLWEPTLQLKTLACWVFGVRHRLLPSNEFLDCFCEARKMSPNREKGIQPSHWIPPDIVPDLIGPNPEAEDGKPGPLNDASPGSHQKQISNEVQRAAAAEELAKQRAQDRVLGACVLLWLLESFRSPKHRKLRVQGLELTWRGSCRRGRLEHPEVFLFSDPAAVS